MTDEESDRINKRAQMAAYLNFPPDPSRWKEDHLALIDRLIEFRQTHSEVAFLRELDRVRKDLSARRVLHRRRESVTAQEVLEWLDKPFFIFDREDATEKIARQDAKAVIRRAIEDICK